MSRRVHPVRSVLEPFAMLAAIFFGIFVIGALTDVRAGGPNLPGSATLGADGAAIVWDTTTPVAYRVDGGNLGNQPSAAAIVRVNSLFQVWEAVPTASIRYSNAGAILSTGAFTDGDVSTVAEFNAVETDCNNGNQTPVVF